MPAGLPQVDAHDVRRIHERIAALQILGTQPVFHLLADDSAFRMPEDQAGSRQLLDGKEIKLLTKHAVIALFRFFDRVQVLLEIFLRVEGSAVDALELRVLFVVQPVGARKIQQLKRLNSSRVGNVGTTAEVYELPIPVERNLVLTLSVLLDEVDFHPVVLGLVLLDRLISWHVLANEFLVTLDDFLHPFFDFLEIVRRERRWAVEVVEEAGVGGWTMPKLGLREKFGDRSSEHVCRRVSKHLQRFGILFREDANLGVFFERTAQVDHFPVHLRRQSSIGQPRRNGLGNVISSAPARQLARGAIGQSDLHGLRGLGYVWHWINPLGIMEYSG